MEGKVHVVKGAIKEKVGDITNNAKLRGEGHAEKVGGKVEHKVGEVKKAVRK